MTSYGKKSNSGAVISEVFQRMTFLFFFFFCLMMFIFLKKEVYFSLINSIEEKHITLEVIDYSTRNLYLPKNNLTSSCNKCKFQW